MLNRSIRFFELTGMNWLIPIANLLAGKNPKAQLNQLLASIGAPLVAFLIFLLLWSTAASNIKTSLGNLPGPSQTWEQFESLVDEHTAARDKEAAFYQRQEDRNGPTSSCACSLLPFVWHLSDAFASSGGSCVAP